MRNAREVEKWRVVVLEDRYKKVSLNLPLKVKIFSDDFSIWVLCNAGCAGPCVYAFILIWWWDIFIPSDTCVLWKIKQEYILSVFITRSCLQLWSLFWARRHLMITCGILQFLSKRKKKINSRKIFYAPLLKLNELKTVVSLDVYSEKLFSFPLFFFYKCLLAVLKRGKGTLLLLTKFCWF